jgi:serine/threonine protein kinase
MLWGNDQIFVAPIVEDRIFQQISVQEQLKEYYNNHIMKVVPSHLPQQQQQEPSTIDTSPAVVTTGRVSDNALDLLQQMLRFDPNNRPTLEEIQQHPWFTEEK